MSEVLGEAVLYLRTDQTQLDAGIARAEGASKASSGRMQSGMDHAARATADAEVKLKSYQLAVDSAQTRVTQLSRALQEGSGDQQKLTEALNLAQGRLSLAQSRLDSYAGKLRNGAAETRSLAAETGISSRAFSDLASHMGPVGQGLTDLTARSRLYRDHGVDYMAAGVIGLEAAFVGLSSHAALEFEELGNKVRQQTGLTGGSLEELMGTIRMVAKDSPYQIQQITDASVQLRQAFGESVPEIRASANEMVAFANYTGQQVTPEMQQLARIMTQYREPLNQVVGLTDKLVSVTQATQQPTQGLTDTLDQFGPKLQALGLNLNDSVRFLALFQASGIKTDQMGRGLASTLTAAGKAQAANNKLVADGPAKLTAYGTAVQGAQVSVDQLAAKLASGKGNQQLLNEQMVVAQARLAAAKDKYETLSTSITKAKGAHQDIASTIRNEIDQIVHANSSQDALNVAVEAFGKNLGPAMARAYYNNAAAVAKVDQALKSTGSTQKLFGVDQESIAGHTQEMKNAFQDLEFVVGTKALPALSDGVKALDGVAHSVDDFYKHHQQLIDMAAGIAGIGSALTLLSRHTPLGSVLGKLIQTDAGGIAGGLRRGVAGVLQGPGGSGISGSRGPVGAGSLANPIAVIVEGGSGNGPPSPTKNVKDDLLKTAEKDAETGTEGAGLAATAKALARRFGSGFLRSAPELGATAALVAAQEALPGAAVKSIGSNLPAPGGIPRSGLPELLHALSGLPSGVGIASGAVIPGRFDMRSLGPSASEAALFDRLKFNAQEATLAVKTLGTTGAGTFMSLARMAKSMNDVPFSFADRVAADMVRAKGVNGRVISDMLKSLRALPAGAQTEAANTAIGMAAQLQAKGALPEGSADKIRAAIVGSFTQMRVDSVAESAAMVTDAGKLVGAFGSSLEGFVNAAAAVFASAPKHPQQVGSTISDAAAKLGVTAPPSASSADQQAKKQAAASLAKVLAPLGGGSSGSLAASSAAPPAPMSIPSQSVGAQTRLAQLQNQLTDAQSAGSVSGQEKALNAEINLERGWLIADKAQLRKIEAMLADRHLSRAKHEQLLADKLAIIQEIGSVSGQIEQLGSTPIATQIPSQLIGAQTKMAELANKLTDAQNAGDTGAQANVLNQEIKLEQSWVAADKKTLAKVQKMLGDRHLSRAQHLQLVQDKLAILQEIGTVSGQIGSNKQSLTGLGGGSGASGFDLSPGGQIKLPTVYDVRTAMGPIGPIQHFHQAAGTVNHTHGWGAIPAALAAHVPAPHVEVKPVFNIDAASKPDATAIKEIIDKSVATMADQIDRGIGSRLHAQTRRTGFRGT